MAKHTWMVTYLVIDDVKQRKVSADFIDDEGAFVTFHEDPDSSTGAGGPVFMAAVEAVITVERLPDLLKA